MSIPFFNENPLIQFEQNHPFHNYLEFQSQNDLSVERNLEIEKKWVNYILIFFKQFFFLYCKLQKIQFFLKRNERKFDKILIQISFLL